MSALPSIWNIIISTLVFFIAAWYINRWLNEQDIPKGMTRSILVFVLACLASWGSGAAIDWLQGSQPKTETTQDASELSHYSSAFSSNGLRIVLVV